MSLSKPMDQSELNRMMRMRAEALTKVFQERSIPLECIYTSWEDAMRAYGSALGPNITDVGLKFRNALGAEGSAETFGFKIRANNFNEILLEIDARRFKITVCDPDSKNPRLVTLAHALENAGKLFGHCGLPEDCNLYHPELDDGKVKLRIDMIYAPQGAKPEGAEFAAKEFCMTAYNFQARTGNARNVILWNHPQGTACMDDESGPMPLYTQHKDPATGELQAFWVEAEDTGKRLDDAHTETAEESAAAAARGKGTAVRQGCDGWDKLPCLFNFIQIPRTQDRPNLKRSFSGSAAQAWGGAVPATMGGGSDDEDDDEKVVYRSLRADGPPSKLTTARLSRGAYAGTHVGVRSAEVKRAPEPLTITSTLVFMLSSEEPPEVDDVVKSWGIVKRMAKFAGTPKELMDEEAGLTTGTALAEEDAAQILEKQQELHAPHAPQPPAAPTVGLVAEA